MGITIPEGAIAIEAVDGPHVATARFSRNPAIPLAIARYNAILIAAAPEMLEALQGIVAGIDAGITSECMRACEHKEHSMLGFARAVIAKAEGK